MFEHMTYLELFVTTQTINSNQFLDFSLIFSFEEIIWKSFKAVIKINYIKQKLFKDQY